MSAKQVYKLIATLVGLLLVIGLIGPVQAGAKVASQAEEAVALSQDGGDTITPPAGVNLSASRPWTAAEMKAAKPYPMPANESVALPTVDPLAGPNGPAGAMAGGKPGGAKAESAADNLAALETSPIFLGYSYPAPFTRQSIVNIVNNYTAKWPYITVGKLFFKQYGGSYVCSAAVVGTGYSSRSIMTAGHCVHAGDNSGNGWSTNMVFVPAYKDGSAPYGQWSAVYSTERVFTSWYTSGDLARDIAGAKLSKNGSGQTITSVVGYLGFAWNQSRNSAWWEIGYPAASPFDGLRMIACQASYAYDSPFGTTPNPMGTGCDMTGGCSGGPWVLKWGVSNWLNGVNSHRTSNKPLELFSPYVDGTVKTSLFDIIVLP